MIHTMSSNKYQRMSLRAGQKNLLIPIFCKQLISTCVSSVSVMTPRVQVTVVLQHTPFANNFWTLLLNFCGCGSSGSCLLMTEHETLCIKALTVQILCRRAQVAGVPVCQFSMGEGHCLMHPHSGRNWWYIIGHLQNCFLDCFLIDKTT